MAAVQRRRVKPSGVPSTAQQQGIAIKPSGLAFTDDGYLLVSSQNQLVKIDLKGTIVSFLGSEKNRKGAKNDELNDPRGIALGKSGPLQQRAAKGLDHA